MEQTSNTIDRSSLSNSILLFLMGLILSSATIFTNVFEIGYSSRVSFAVLGFIFFLKLLMGYKLKALPLIYILFLIFIIWMAIGLAYTRAPNYGASKLIKAASYYLILTFMIYNLITNLAYLNTFFLGLLIGGLLLMLSLLLLFGDPLTTLGNATRFFRLRLGDSGNPIILARTLGVLSILSIYYILNRESYRIKFIMSIVFISATLYMVATGSKGPLLALVISTILSLSLVSKYSFVTMILMSTIFGILGVTLNGYLPEEFLIERYFQTEGALTTRESAYYAVIASVHSGDILSLVFGEGTGDYAYYATNKDLKGYPHNIFLEIVYENGIIALILFIFTITIPIISVVQFRFSNGIDNKFRSTIFVCLALYIFVLLNAQVSGDIAENSTIPIFGILLLSLLNFVTKKHG